MEQNDPIRSPEYLQELGVWDPDEPDAEERLAVLRRLVELGAGPEDLAGSREDAGAIAFGLAVRPGKPRYTAAEVAEFSGIPVDDVRRLYLAAGLPFPGDETPVFSDEDVSFMEVVRLGAALYGRDEMIQLVRVAGSSMAKLADAGSSVFFSSVAPRMVDDPTGRKAVEFNDMAAALISRMAHALEIMLRHHLVAVLRGGEETPEGGVDTRMLTVGFVDMSGSTALAQQLELGDLSRVISDFETIVTDMVAATGGRVLKFIGDEVMFSTESPVTACRLALEVFDLCARNERIPPLRCGMAYGLVVARGGDCFGPIVNLASRLANIASSGSILVSGDLRKAVSGDGDALEFTQADPVTLKGFDEPEEIWTLRSPGWIA